MKTPTTSAIHNALKPYLNACGELPRSAVPEATDTVLTGFKNVFCGTENGCFIVKGKRVIMFKATVEETE